MKVLLIGANGKIGRILAQKLAVADEYEPTAMIRKEEQKSYFEAIGVPTVLASLEDSGEALGEVVNGFDAVVFSAGSGGKTGYDKTLEIDLDGAIKSVHAAEKNGAKRFIIVSAAHADNRDFWGNSSIKPYYIAKHYADEALRNSTLDYTILRPTALTDDEEIGKVKLETDPNKLERQIPRVTVAEVIVRILDDARTYGKTIEMSSGHYYYSIADAIDAFTAEN